MNKKVYVRASAEDVPITYTNAEPFFPVISGHHSSRSNCKDTQLSKSRETFKMSQSASNRALLVLERKSSRQA